MSMVSAYSYATLSDFEPPWSTLTERETVCHLSCDKRSLAWFTNRQLPNVSGFA